MARDFGRMDRETEAIAMRKRRCSLLFAVLSSASTQVEC